MVLSTHPHPRRMSQRSASRQPLKITINPFLSVCKMTSVLHPLVYFNVWVFSREVLVTPPPPAPSHLLGVHGALGPLGRVGVEPEDGLVAHGTHAADLQPLQQAPERTATESNCCWTESRDAIPESIFVPEGIFVHWLIMRCKTTLMWKSKICVRS